MEKISFDKYQRWRVSFFKDADNKRLRFGQAFINTFYPSVGQAVSQVFYETDMNKAEEIILRDYVEAQ